MPESRLKAEGPDFARRLARADQDAWQSLFETYAEPLFLYIYHKTSDRQAAEDLRQETFIEAVRGIGRYRQEAPLFSWLCGIARHRTASYLRRKRQLVPLEDAGDKAVAAGAAVDLGHTAAVAEMRSLVVETLWSLPQDYRKALVLRYVEGLSVEQVASATGRSYKAAESLLSRARREFERKYLEASQG